jgi:predicted nucleotide-binding protein
VESYAAGHHIGELAALQVTNRSTTVTALGDVVALKVTKTVFKQFLSQFPKASYALAQELAHRLVIRNANIAKPNPKQRIFAISSAEALKVALSGTAQFIHDKEFEYAPWISTEVFKLSGYPLDDLEAELARADFAIAIAQDDDLVLSRDKEATVPRDNVLFELGMFMGRLGRKRTVLMVPQGKNVKLPSDLTGLTVISYPSEMTKPQELAIWEQIKGHFRTLIQ